MHPLVILFLVSLISVSLWFKEGLLFAGAEEQLSFYNYSKSLELFSHIWYAAGTGYPALTSIPRVPYFLLFEPLYRIGIPSVLLEAITFLILILIGTISVYYLIKVTVASELREEWKRLVPFLAAIFYFLNPFSMTQIWGRALSYQFFSFALIPSFLLLFVISLKRRNLIFCLIGALFSFFLSVAYLSPAVVLTSWSSIAIYLVYYTFTNRNNNKILLFSFFSLMLLFLSWFLINQFWIYPFIKHGGEMLTENLTVRDNIESLRALSPNSNLLNVVRLIHREYYDGTYGYFYNNFIIILVSWILPLSFIFSFTILKRTSHFLFYLLLLIISIFISIGANFPTGWLLIWLFTKIPLLQVLRNPYEKYGINLTLAYTPFFAVGLLIISEKITFFYNYSKLKYIVLSVLLCLLFIALVGPFWKGNFAGGIKVNFWVEIPAYYKQANEWLNSQKGNFNILQLPSIPEDGITFNWDHPYEGIESSEFLFDRPSVSRNFVYNKAYYSALIERFGTSLDYKSSPYFSEDNNDFKDESLVKELAKLNIRFIVLHFDTDYGFRRATSPQNAKEYLEHQEGIRKVNQFGLLEIYSVEIPQNIDLIYSPQVKVNYQKVNTTKYFVDVEDAKEEFDLIFLQQFHPGWAVFIDGRKVNNHSKVFSYANKWKIKRLGKYQLEIKFIQQDAVILGAKITTLTLLSILIILLFRFSNIRKLFF